MVTITPSESKKDEYIVSTEFVMKICSLRNNVV